MANKREVCCFGSVHDFNLNCHETVKNGSFKRFKVFVLACQRTKSTNLLITTFGKMWKRSDWSAEWEKENDNENGVLVENGRSKIRHMIFIFFVILMNLIPLFFLSNLLLFSGIIIKRVYRSHSQQTMNAWSQHTFDYITEMWSITKRIVQRIEHTNEWPSMAHIIVLLPI